VTRTSWTPPPELLEAFMELGRCGPSPQRLRLVADHDAASRLHWTTWSMLKEEMDADDLFALLRGIVIAEGKLRWFGGSVAGGIWLAKLLVERFPETWESVATWLHENNRQNDYLTSSDRPHSL
jgi:hypothetical protein